MGIEKAYNSQGNLEEEEPSYESYIRYQDIAMEINTAQCRHRIHTQIEYKTQKQIHMNMAACFMTKLTHTVGKERYFKINDAGSTIY